MKTVLDIHGLSKNFDKTSYPSGSSSNDKRGRYLWTYWEEWSWEDYLNKKLLRNYCLRIRGLFPSSPAKRKMSGASLYLE